MMGLGTRLICYTLAAALGVCAWALMTNKIALAQATEQVEQCNVSLGKERVYTGTLKLEIQRQNDASAAIAFEAEMKKLQALLERDKALEQLGILRKKHNDLRASWPQECVAAITLVRQELGL